MGFWVVGSIPTIHKNKLFRFSHGELEKYSPVRPYIRPTCYPAVSGGESVVRLSLGKLSVNQLQVVKRTNTPLLSL